MAKTSLDYAKVALQSREITAQQIPSSSTKNEASLHQTARKQADQILNRIFRQGVEDAKSGKEENYIRPAGY